MSPDYKTLPGPTHLLTNIPFLDFCLSVTGLGTTSVLNDYNAFHYLFVFMLVFFLLNTETICLCLEYFSKL